MLDAQALGEEYKIEACDTQTVLANRLADRIDKKGYSLFDCLGTVIPTSFIEAWAVFREIRERQSNYVTFFNVGLTNY